MKNIILFTNISNGNKEAFNTLFRGWYTRLLCFAKHYLNNEADAEETVSDVFISLWQNRASLDSIINPENYLFVSTKNRCLNVLRNQTMRKISLDDQPQLKTYVSESAQERIEHIELVEKLNELVNLLPEQCRIIFQMIKEDGLSAKQTAEILNLSVRTVESQVYKAVKTLEEGITHYLGYSPRKVRNPQMRGVLVIFL
jgi:RNA polymerase sigma-70 factor (family 1)